MIKFAYFNHHLHSTAANVFEDDTALLVVKGDEREGDLVALSSVDSSSKTSHKLRFKLMYTSQLRESETWVMRARLGWWTKIRIPAENIFTIPSLFLFCLFFLFLSIFATSDFSSPYTLRMSLIFSVRRRIRSELSWFFNNSSTEINRNLNLVLKYDHLMSTKMKYTVYPCKMLEYLYYYMNIDKGRCMM